MTDAYNQLSQQTQIHIQDLSALIVMFKKLRDTLIEDRQDWSITGADMSQLIDHFGKQLQNFSSLTSTFQEEFIKCLQEHSQQSVQSISQYMGQVLKQALDREIDLIVRQLDRTTQQASERIENAEDKLARSRWWALGICISCSLFGGLIGGTIVHRTVPAHSFTRHEHNLMLSGEMIGTAWNGLSQKEQEKIRSLYNNRR